MKLVRVIDSHTAGEPTRAVVEGGPDLGNGPVARRAQIFREQHDPFRSAVVNEPRGGDVLVGALLLPPENPDCRAAVIFFNNVGLLGMCGHGMIGVVSTLAYLGKIQPGWHRMETPVGEVRAELLPDGQVSVENVESFRRHKAVAVRLPGWGELHGDVAWGGNWFFLTEEHRQEILPKNVAALSEFAWQIRLAVNEQVFAEVDHIELFGAPTQAEADSKNFVLCPGKAYDRSPCGTGTSAKLACLAADGLLEESETWRQEGILGTVFSGQFRRHGDRVRPTITGQAYINGESSLILDPRDPFCWGIRPAGGQ